MSAQQGAAPVRVAVLTVSDGVAHGSRADRSGDAIAGWVEQRGHHLAERAVLADEADAIAARIARWCDDGVADLVVSTGGTGLTARDVTPEATRSILDREVPGIAEAMRAAGARSTPYASLSRGVAGTRRRTLVVNLPGSTGGVRDGLAVLDPLVAHAVQLLRGEHTHRHDPPHG